MYAAQSFLSGPDGARALAVRLEQFMGNEIRENRRLSISRTHAHLARTWVTRPERSHNAVLLSVMVDAGSFHRIGNNEPDRQPRHPLSVCISYERCDVVVCMALKARSVVFTECYHELGEKRLKDDLKQIVQSLVARYL